MRSPTSVPHRWQRLAIWLLFFTAAVYVIGTVLADRLANRHVYRIGWEDHPPEQSRGADGQPTGLAIEVVREAARRRGIRLTWIRSSVSSEAAIRSGQVDLWPLMTITPERLRVLHISAPHLDSEMSFVIRRDSQISSLTELSAKRVGYISLFPADYVPRPINLQLAERYVPNAVLAPHPTPEALLASLCNKDLDAAFLEQNGLMQQLMNRRRDRDCGQVGFALVTPPQSRISLGVASTLQSGAIADTLREEIDVMAADGFLEAVFSRWGYLSGRSVSYVDALRAARQREHWTDVAAGVFLILLLVAVWFSWRFFLESKRAGNAERSLRERIRESRQMEAQIRLLAHAVENAGDCISITDTAGRLLYANQAFLGTYEYTREELIGQSVELLRSSGPARIVTPGITEALTSETWRGELWNRSRSGREFPVTLSTSAVLDDDGHVVARIGIASDISARRQAEEEYRALQQQYLQAQKLESVGQLAGGIAHDFNNLLTIILGYSRLLLARVGEDSRSLQPLRHISSAAEKATALTQRLLTFSRKHFSSPATLSVGSVVRDIVPMLSRLIEENIEIQVVSGDEPDTVFADATLVEQVLINLAVNARDAMPDGGSLVIETASLTVSGDRDSNTPQVPDGRYVLLTVTDTGIGMTPEVQSRIFEPFFTTKEPGKGTGLGLATVYGIVSDSGGGIAVSSAPGSGTTVRVAFPFVDGRPVPVGKGEAPRDLRGAETILVVEDEDGVRDFVREVLEDRGYRVLAAACGKEAVNFAGNYSDIDLILTDMVLPGLSSQDTVRQLLELIPGTPVIRMSGYAERFEALTDQRPAFIQKPFSPDKLLLVIRTTLA